MHLPTTRRRTSVRLLVAFQVQRREREVLNIDRLLVNGTDHIAAGPLEQDLWLRDVDRNNRKLGRRRTLLHTPILAQTPLSTSRISQQTRRSGAAADPPIC